MLLRDQLHEVLLQLEREIEDPTVGAGDGQVLYLSTLCRPSRVPIPGVPDSRVVVTDDGFDGEGHTILHSLSDELFASLFQEVCQLD